MNRQSKIILTISMLVSLLSLFFLYQAHIFSARTDVSGIVIGEVEHINGDVRSRQSNEIAWHESIKGEEVKINDSVFTGESSKAAIKLKDSEFVMEENTLIVFRAEPKYDRLSLAYGSLYGSFNKDKKRKLIIDLGNGKQLSFDSGSKTQFLIKKTSSGSSVKVISGKATFMEKGNSFEVAENSKFDLDNPRTEPVTKLTQQETLEVKAALKQPFKETQREISSEKKPKVLPKKKPVAAPPATLKQFVQVVEKKKAEKKKRQKKQNVKKVKPDPILANLEKPLSSDDGDDFWVNFGFGANFVNFAQNNTGRSSLEYQSFKLPSYSFTGGAMLAERHGFEAMYKDTPGEIENSANGQGLLDYNWKSMSAEYLYGYSTKENWWRDFKKTTRLRAGFQYHNVPFLLTDSSSQITIHEHSILNLSVGFEHHLERNNNRFEWMMRYQHPIYSAASGSNQFDVSSTFSFDGSVGFRRLMANRWTIGFYWYGQWLIHGHQFQNDTLNFSGDQNLFHSTIDLKLGFEF